MQVAKECAYLYPRYTCHT